MIKGLSWMRRWSDGASCRLLLEAWRNNSHIFSTSWAEVCPFLKESSTLLAIPHHVVNVRRLLWGFGRFLGNRRCRRHGLFRKFRRQQIFLRIVVVVTHINSGLTYIGGALWTVAIEQVYIDINRRQALRAHKVSFLILEFLE